jgi:nucleotide-binding universal stress UspA family protein
MQRFKDILLVLNPEMVEKAALDKAISLAKENGARLTLFSVLKEPPGLQGYSKSVVQHQLESATTERRELLRSLMIPSHEEGIDVVINVVVGISFLEIIRQVLREQHDLVIINAEEKEGIRARLFGTTAMHLMRKCPCPVLVVKRAQIRPYTRILAAVAPSEHYSKRDLLNPLILQLAGSMAHREAAELHVVHVLWHFSDHTGIQHTTEEAQEAKGQVTLQHKQYFDALLGEANISSLKPYLHLLEGDPDERIPELVKEQNIDLLVMGTVCHTGIAGFLIGNTAEEILNQVDCSVLALKPKGFVTPVILE